MASNIDQTLTEQTNGFSGDVQEKINSLMKTDKELNEIREYLIQEKLGELNKEGSGFILKAALPSFIVLLLSFFIDVGNVPFLGKIAVNFANMIFPGSQILNTGVEPLMFWWIPLVAYLIFILVAISCNRALKDEITKKGTSENSVSRIIDGYSGIVNGIGTALPLIGAAILLVSIKEGPVIFLGFSVPFEIKSIIILAIALLFESVFDAQALKYQRIIEEIKKIESEYFFKKTEHVNVSILNELKSTLSVGGGKGQGMSLTNEQLERMYAVVKLTNDLNEKFSNNLKTLTENINKFGNIKIIDDRIINELIKVSQTYMNVIEASNKSSEVTKTIKTNLESINQIITNINSMKLPDEKVLKELQVTAHFLTETMNNMKDAATAKSLENLVYIAGKR